MRDPNQQNIAVLRHWLRRELNGLLRGAPGLGPGGSLWKKIAGVVRLVDAANPVLVGDFEAARIFFTGLLRNAEDGTQSGIGEIQIPESLEVSGSFGSDQNDWDLGPGVIHRVAPTASGLSITGLLAPAGSTGRIRVLLNDGTSGFTIKHNDAGSSGANRILTPFGLPLLIPPGAVDTFSHGVLLYYLGEPAPLPLRWAAYPLGGASPFRVWGGEIQQQTANGALWTRGSATELMTIAAAGFTDSAANLLPVDSVIEAVVGRVTVTIPTATSFRVGDPTTTRRFSATDPSTAAPTTFRGIAHHAGSVITDAAGPTQLTAAPVRLTMNGGTPANNSGRVRVTVFYRTFVAPTS